MTPTEQRTVRMVCTDDGRHHRNVLMPWHFGDGGRPEEDPLHPGRTGLERAVYQRQTGRAMAYGRMKCHRCGRELRIGEEPLTLLMTHLFETSDEVHVTVDVSAAPYARLFGG